MGEIKITDEELKSIELVKIIYKGDGYCLSLKLSSVFLNIDLDHILCKVDTMEFATTRGNNVLTKFPEAKSFPIREIKKFFTEIKLRS